ncbi:hypothetical protein [Oceanobacillus rekensis]|nr:hypothetical protein [Oceanobacillus rekensis]
MIKLWHRFRLMYFNTIYQDCIDAAVREKIRKKIRHHESYLYDLEQSAN